MLRRFLVGNWKMNLGLRDSTLLAGEIARGYNSAMNTAVWLAPSALALQAVSAAVKGSGIQIGCQNAHWETSGAFTGEDSPTQIQEAGGSFAIIGHSERRGVFAESEILCARRAIGALAHGLQVIFCIGETLQQRSDNQTAGVLKSQLEPLISNIPSGAFRSLLLAYEPVWAIGTGMAASLEEIRSAHAMVNEYWQSKSGEPCPPILYGGSVSADNFAQIISLPFVRGGLVGGASLEPQKFLEMLRISESLL